VGEAKQRAKIRRRINAGLLEMHTEGGGLYAAAVLTDLELIGILGKWLATGELSWIERAVLSGAQQLKAAMNAGEERERPMCGCLGCPTAFSTDRAESPALLVMIYPAVDDPSTYASMSAICRRCAAAEPREELVLRVVRTFNPDARILPPITAEAGRA
jgi:hypothetical protein